MDKVETTKLDERDLPEEIDYYVINADGSVVNCSILKADVYINENDVRYFTDKEAMLYVRDTFGPYIGVMRDTSFIVKAREYRTPKMLLGVVRGFG